MRHLVAGSCSSSRRKEYIYAQMGDQKMRQRVQSLPKAPMTVSTADCKTSTHRSKSSMRPAAR